MHETYINVTKIFVFKLDVECNPPPSLRITDKYCYNENVCMYVVCVMLLQMRPKKMINDAHKLYFSRN